MTSPTIGQRVADGLLLTYQRHISRDLNAANGAHCIYTPSCSSYARDAVREQGAGDGLLNAAGHFARCNRTWREKNHAHVVEALQACRDADEVISRFRFDDDEARETMLQLHAEMEATRRLAALGRTRDSEGAERAWHRRLQHELHVLTEDLPTAHRTGRFIVSHAHRHTDACHHDPSPPAAPPADALSWARRVSGGVAAGVVGAALGSVIAGTLTGFVLAPMVAAGRSHEIQTWLSKRCGDDGAEALTAIIEKATGPTGPIRSAVTSLTHSDRAGAVAGSLVGIPCGLVQGVVAGALTGATWGWRVGHAYT